ncbi:hypothetical protein LIA77_05620 [Sarocladium implicatum]|nr:hypothetical protein LIA77_05620 [Sarocladium implicatum]
MMERDARVWPALYEKKRIGLMMKGREQKRRCRGGRPCINTVTIEASVDAMPARQEFLLRKESAGSDRCFFESQANNAQPYRHASAKERRCARRSQLLHVVLDSSSQQQIVHGSTARHPDSDFGRLETEVIDVPCIACSRTGFIGIPLGKVTVALQTPAPWRSHCVSVQLFPRRHARSSSLGVKHDLAIGSAREYLWHPSMPHAQLHGRIGRLLLLWLQVSWQSLDNPGALAFLDSGGRCSCLIVNGLTRAGCL